MDGSTNVQSFTLISFRTDFQLTKPSRWFEYYHPYIHIVEKDLFFKALADGPPGTSGYCSALLVNWLLFPPAAVPEFILTIS